MSPTIHCIRHAEGFHNIDGGNYELLDPKLTPSGEEQCRALKDECFSDQSKISLITASALSRTIHTAYVTFKPCLESQQSPTRILALPDAQETSDDPCDHGSDPEDLKKVCEDSKWPVDLSLIKEGWNSKKIGGRYSPASKAIQHRARDLRRFLRQQARQLVNAGDADAQIVLVTHGGFLHYFSEDWENPSLRSGTGWVNCETRAYTFEHDFDSDEDADAHLVETPESRQRRGMDHPMYPQEQQQELYLQAMQAWEDQGLQNPSKIEHDPEQADT